MREHLDKKAKLTKQRIISSEGWFVPTLHNKYLTKRPTEILED
jgi:hypothetical protein